VGCVPAVGGGSGVHGHSARRCPPWPPSDSPRNHQRGRCRRHRAARCHSADRKAAGSRGGGHTHPINGRPGTGEPGRGNSNTTKRATQAACRHHAPPTQGGGPTFRSRCTIDSACRCAIPLATCCAINTRRCHSSVRSGSCSATRSDPPAISSVTIKCCPSAVVPAPRNTKRLGCLIVCSVSHL
jgi:hypothetical protein